MSGGDYTCSFGERMKDFPRTPHRGPLPRPPLWFRARRSWTAGGAKRRSFGPWIYFYWERKLGEAEDFARNLIGSWRQVERLGKEKPGDVADVPYGYHAGVSLFMGKF
jgi:hypothetical protein